MANALFNILDYTTFPGTKNEVCLIGKKRLYLAGNSISKKLSSLYFLEEYYRYQTRAGFQTCHSGY